ncbi:hypothetical protein OPQ81_002764 [Rhizoctonia solani]|nr:hypothetical protein OPQ81_002764 [Rhizoctonia solani]
MRAGVTCQPQRNSNLRVDRNRLLPSRWRLLPTPLLTRTTRLVSPLPPPRSPGARPPSPFSAPASNYLTVKREKADITGSWNINTALPAPPSHRTFSLESDDGDTNLDDGTETSDPSTQATSSGLSSSPALPPNLKLLTPRGKIDAVIRVWGGPRAWIETISRDEDVAVTFPPASGGGRSPIKLLARSTSGNVQVHLPQSFMGTLRVPSDVVLPPSLRSQSVILSPSEPPIDRPPIPDESPVKGRLSLGSAGLAVPSSPPASVSLSARLENLVSPITREDPISIPLPPSPAIPSPSNPTEEPVPQVDTPAQEMAPPISPPASMRSASTRGSTLSPTDYPKHHRHHGRSSSASAILSHTSLPTATHQSSECSTVYFIGDLLHSGYDNNAPEKWTGDEFVIDKGVTRSVKDAMDWDKWKNAGSDAGRGLRDKMPLVMPKISVGGLGRRLKFGK